MFGQDSVPRRFFLQFLGGVAISSATEGLSGATRSLWAQTDASGARGGPDDPEAPNAIVARILKERFGERAIQRGHVTLDMPDVAEDGRVIPASIESDLPVTGDQYVKAVYLIVDHNPDPLVTVFHLTPAIGAVAIGTRIKMRRTCWIRAIVESSNGELWADYKRVTTSLNGCG